MQDAERHEDICLTHNQPLTVYCKNSRCQAPLCVRCFMLKHKDHEVVDLEDMAEEGKHELKNIEKKCREVIEMCINKEKALETAEIDLRSNTSRAIDDVDRTRMDLLKEIQQVAEELKIKISTNHEDQGKEIAQAKQKILYSKESFEEVQDIIGDILHSNNSAEIMKNVKGIKQNYEHLYHKDIKKLEASLKFHRTEFHRAEITKFADNVFGKICQENVTASKSSETRPKTSLRSNEMVQTSRNNDVTQSGTPKAILQSRWDTELTKFGAIGVSEDGDITVAGHDGKTWRIKQYRVNGESAWYHKTTHMDMTQITGICHLKTPYRKYVALSDSIKINLIDTNRKVVSTFFHERIAPEALCSFTMDSNQTVLAVNTSTEIPQCQLESLSFDKDSLTDMGRPMNTEMYNVYGLCIYQMNNRKVIAMASSGMVFALDLSSRKMLWRIDEKWDSRQVDPRDICCDDAGHLYIADGTNKRVLVASTHGKVLRTLTRSPGNSWAIKWIKAHNKLLHLYEQDKSSKISVFKITFENK